MTVDEIHGFRPSRNALKKSRRAEATEEAEEENPKKRKKNKPKRNRNGTIFVFALDLNHFRLRIRLKPVSFPHLVSLFVFLFFPFSQYGGFFVHSGAIELEEAKETTPSQRSMDSEDDEMGSSRDVVKGSSRKASKKSTKKGAKRAARAEKVPRDHRAMDDVVGGDDGVVGDDDGDDDGDDGDDGDDDDDDDTYDETDEDDDFVSVLPTSSRRWLFLCDTDHDPDVNLRQLSHKFALIRCFSLSALKFRAVLSAVPSESEAAFIL